MSSRLEQHYFFFVFFFIFDLMLNSIIDEMKRNIVTARRERCCPALTLHSEPSSHTGERMVQRPGGARSSSYRGWSPCRAEHRTARSQHPPQCGPGSWSWCSGPPEDRHSAWGRDCVTVLHLVESIRHGDTSVRELSCLAVVPSPVAAVSSPLCTLEAAG